MRRGARRQLHSRRNCNALDECYDSIAPFVRSAYGAVNFIDDDQVRAAVAEDGLHRHRILHLLHEILRAAVVARVNLHDAVPSVFARDMREGRLPGDRVLNYNV